MVPLKIVMYLYECQFKDKTKNNWEDRGNFVKHDKKYHYIERDYGADDD